MASHRTHYAQGCNVGKRVLVNGSTWGETLEAFNASRFSYRCQACNKAAMRDGYAIEPELVELTQAQDAERLKVRRKA